MCHSIIWKDDTGNALLRKTKTKWIHQVNRFSKLKVVFLEKHSKCQIQLVRLLWRPINRHNSFKLLLNYLVVKSVYRWSVQLMCLHFKIHHEIIYCLSCILLNRICSTSYWLLTMCVVLKDSNVGRLDRCYFPVTRTKHDKQNIQVKTSFIGKIRLPRYAIWRAEFCI